MTRRGLFVLLGVSFVVAWLLWRGLVPVGTDEPAGRVLHGESAVEGADVAPPSIGAGLADVERIGVTTLPAPGDGLQTEVTVSPVPVHGPIHGTVVDVEGFPIVGAIVRFVPSTRTAQVSGQPSWMELPDRMPELVITSTDERGEFHVSGPHVPPEPGGSMLGVAGVADPVLLVSAEGYATWPFGLTGYQSGEYEAGTLTLPPGGAVTGRCVDGAGRPLAGVLVRPRVEPWPPHDWQESDPSGRDWVFTSFAAQRTGDDGSFGVSGLPGRRVRIFASLAGYIQVWPRFGVELGASKDVGDIVLERGGALRGLVLGAEDAPVVGARLYARKWEPGDIRELDGPEVDATATEMMLVLTAGAPAPGAVSDDVGRFEITGLSPDRYAVHVDAEGYEWTTLAAVEPDAEELLIELAPQATALLTLVDEVTGERVVDAQVEAFRRPTVTSKTRPGDPHLTLKFGDEALQAAGLTGDPAGVVLVQRPGRLRTDVVVEAQGYASRGFQLQGVPASSAFERTLELTPEVLIAGTVRDTTGAAVVGATIRCIGPSSSRVVMPSVTAQTDPEGHFEVHGLLPAEWRVIAKSPGLVSGELVVQVPRADDAEVTPETRAALRTLEFELGPTGAIFGQTVEKDGRLKPRMEFFLKLTPPSAQSYSESVPRTRSVTSDPRGHFRVEGLAPGTWTVSQQVVEVPPGGEVEVLVYPKCPTAIVRGRVLDAEGPVAGARVEAAVKTGWKGSWTAIESVKTSKTGDYELAFWHATPVRLLARGAQLSSVPSQVVELEAQLNTELVQDLWLAGGRVAGRVVSARSGDPVADAQVMLEPLHGDLGSGLVMDIQGMDGARQEVWPRTDVDGHFNFQHVGPGAYRLLVEHPGFSATALGPLKVAADGNLVGVEVQLAGQAHLDVLVRLPGDLHSPFGTAVSVQPDQAYPRVEFGQVEMQGKLTRRLPEALSDWPVLGFTRDGQVRFTGLRPGGWWVRVLERWPEEGQVPPATLVEQHVMLTDGETRELTLVTPR